MAMRVIDEGRLESDTGYRFAYVAEFIGFGASDIDAIHDVTPELAPRVAGLVDAVYDKLHAYDATWRHFLPRQHGYEGGLAGSLESLTPDHEVIRFRKQHLARYLTALVTKPYDGKMVQYLDMVGKMHTPKAGSADLDVPLVQMNALMGFVADALSATLFDLKLGCARTQPAVRAFQKLLWIQNDLITRHYQAAAEPVGAA